MNAQAKKLADMNETQLRAAAGNSIRKVTRFIAEKLSPDDAWRLSLVAALSVMLPELGDKLTAAVLHELAADIENGDEAPLLN